jgi:hypothetical protein
MIHSRLVQVNNEDFEVTFSGKAWQQCKELETVDGTIEMAAHSAQRPELKFVCFIHGHLSRIFPNGPFAVEVSLSQAREVLEYALFEWAEEEVLESSDIYRPECYRITDARWRMEDCSVPETHAMHYAGGNIDSLDAELKLGSSPWMQDWPLEVSDRHRVEEFCAFYDQTIDRFFKFDTMQLALFSYDDSVRYSLFSYGKRTQLDEKLSEWFDRTLRRDFSLHGNTIAHYWAELDRESDDPELSLTDPEFVCPISGQLRRIWEASLIPIDLHLPDKFWLGEE